MNQKLRVSHGRRPLNATRNQTKTWQRNSAVRLVTALVVLGVASSPVVATTYNYDDAGRLTGVIYDDGSRIDYTYDNNSNLLTIAKRDPSGSVPPACADVQIVTDANVSGSVRANCSDADGDPLSYAIVSQPADGGASVSGDNLQYTPDLNFSGTDSFTYLANDGTADSNIATVSVTVNDVAAPQPVTLNLANGDSTPVDTSVSAGTVGVVLMRFEVDIVVESALSALTLQATGSGDSTTGVTAVRLYEDVNANGLVDSGDALVGEGQFTANGLFDLAINPSYELAAGRRVFLVVYDFAG